MIRTLRGLFWAAVFAALAFLILFLFGLGSGPLTAFCMLLAVSIAKGHNAVTGRWL